MLEQQQSQLVAGLRELYGRLHSGEGWPGVPLKTSHSGHPLTHDILDRLDLLHSTSDTPIKHEGFEDDLSRLQHRCLVENGSPPLQRKRALSEESEPALSPSGSSHGMSSPDRNMSFLDPFSKKRSPPTPPMEDIPYYRPSQTSQQEKFRQFDSSTMGQTRGLNPMEMLQRQSWHNQQLSMESSLDADLFSPYNTTMGFDTSSLFATSFSPQAPDLMMNFGDPLDFINPRMMQA